MEWALQLANIQDWPVEEKYPYNRLYFGSEFCQNRVPGEKQVLAAWNQARSKGWAFTLVTPYVTEKGLAKITKILEALVNNTERSDGKEEKMEVVVNDWGVFQLLTTRFPQLTPVMGRLLQKVLRDPRVINSKNEEKISGPAVVESSGLDNCSLTNLWFSTFLKKRGVVRVEFDNLLQGLEVNLKALGFVGSLYFPYGCITTGRACLPGSLNKPAAEKFRGASRCGQECREVNFVLQPGDYQVRGNTVFYLQNERQIEQGLTNGGALGFDRAIFLPD